jgi:hypothetical protein
VGWEVGVRVRGGGESEGVGSRSERGGVGLGSGEGRSILFFNYGLVEGELGLASLQMITYIYK